MEDLFKPIKTTRRVQHNIEKFETLSLRDTPTSRPASTNSKASIVDLSSESSDGVSEPFSLRPSVDSATTALSAQSTHKNHKRHDSTVFLEKSYLKETSANTLPDDAQAILKSKPDREDLVAVLQYLQYGVDGKHDFNVRLPGPKAAQIINTLVTVTIPDQWLHLRGHNLAKPEELLKKLIITPLVSVAGIGALLMQIRHISSTTPADKNPFLEDAMSILATILERHSVLRRFMSDSNSFFTADTPRRVFWQEATALVAGSKVFTTMAQVYATIPTVSDRMAEFAWLADGPAYSEWLSRNISVVAIDLNNGISTVNEPLNMLGQVFKRGLSLGYRGLS